MTIPDMKEPSFEDLELLAEVSQLLKLLELDTVLDSTLSISGGVA